MALDFDQELRTAIGTAESLYGPRDPTFHLLPVAYHQKNYAQSLVNQANRTISVKLADPAVFEDKETEARYELWHEAVHCLAPVERMDTLWFEEGIALRFALTHSPLTPIQKMNNRKALREPWNLCCTLLIGLILQTSQIKEIRNLSCNGLFDTVTAELMIKICDAKPKFAHKLCQRLPSNRR